MTIADIDILRHRLLARVLAALAAAWVLLALNGCYTYPYPPPGTPSTFDRAFDAATGAMTDYGLVIRSADRAAGVVVGTSGGLTLTASVRPQPDGTTRVEFNQSGPQAQDPGLVNRVVAAYNRRMGR